MGWLPMGAFEASANEAKALSVEERIALTWEGARRFVLTDTFELTEWFGYKASGRYSPWEAVRRLKRLPDDDGPFVPSSPPESCEWLGAFDPVDTLVYYDGPRTFTVRDRGGNLLLAYMATDYPHPQFILLPVTAEGVDQLVAGEIEVRPFLRNNAAWLVMLGDGDRPSVCWRVKGNELPDDFFPDAGVTMRHSPAPVAEQP